MYKDILVEEYVEQYKINHMTLFREINIMLFDVAFLKECTKYNDIILDTDIAISYLFKNNFEHLILKVYRIMFDNGADVLSIDTFTNQIIKSINSPEFKKSICTKISKSCWKSCDIKAVKKRLEPVLLECRNKLIAHKLMQDISEFTVNLNDISTLLNAAIDIFEMLSFYPLDFYDYNVTENEFVAEYLTVKKKSKELLELLLLSSHAIKHIDVSYYEFAERESKERIQNFVTQYNTSKEQDDSLTQLLIHSKISVYTRTQLLSIEEFKDKLLQCSDISDSKILEIAKELRSKFSENTDKISKYKLSIIDSCIKKISELI